MNIHDEDQRHAARYNAACEAVRTHFSHLSIAHIVEPPHQWFDAMLARQIAIHILNHFFDVPRKRIVKMMDRPRQRIGEAIAAIEQRLDDATFEAAYRTEISLKAPEEQKKGG